MARQLVKITGFLSMCCCRFNFHISDKLFIVTLKTRNM